MVANLQRAITGQAGNGEAVGFDKVSTSPLPGPEPERGIYAASTGAAQDARKSSQASASPSLKRPEARAPETALHGFEEGKSVASYRSIWISDVHLGTKHAQVGKLLDFLRDTECEHLYIVGDFIDGWQLRRKWYWTQDYNLLIQKLLRKNRKKTRVTFITGNHDEFLEKFLGMSFGAVDLAERVVHTTADGKRYLVIHGHQFDGLSHFNRLLDRVGTVLYDRILDMNVWINRARRMLGFGYWSFASYIKLKAKAAVKYVTDYEDAMIQFARKSGMSGVICGHIHRPEIRDLGDIFYMNCGDWVENCTALAEDFEGKFTLIRTHLTNREGPRGQGIHTDARRNEGKYALPALEGRAT